MLLTLTRWHGPCLRTPPRVQATWPALAKGEVVQRFGSLPLIAIIRRAARSALAMGEVVQRSAAAFSFDAAAKRRETNGLYRAATAGGGGGSDANPRCVIFT